ncbi:YraN family protein [Candidatus Parcubacteria bacterium]|nr:YraN family protein [Candidatus Parcubacteria bacterium]
MNTKTNTKINTKNKLLVGALGEEIACRFLISHKYDLLDRNFRQKCGEIDIIAEKMGVLHFLEVKTVSRERSRSFAGGTSGDVTHETSSLSGHRPEDNMHFRKLQRLERTIQIYLAKRRVPHETRFQIDGVTVYLHPECQKASVKLIENINL